MRPRRRHSSASKRVGASYCPRSTKLLNDAATSGYKSERVTLTVPDCPLEGVQSTELKQCQLMFGLLKPVHCHGHCKIYAFCALTEVMAGRVSPID